MLKFNSFATVTMTLLALQDSYKTQSFSKLFLTIPLSLIGYHRRFQ